LQLGSAVPWFLFGPGNVVYRRKCASKTDC
jgi:hypothetical protein